MADTDPETPVGAVVTVVSLDWWSAELARSNLPDGSVGYVVDANDQIVAAFPDRADRIGQFITSVGHDVGIPNSEPSEIFVEADGIRRVFSFRRLYDDQGESRIAMLVGVPIDIGIAEANRLFFARLLGLGGVLASLFALLYVLMDRRIFGPLRKMAQDFELIEKGNFSNETSLDFADASNSPRTETVARRFQDIASRSFHAESERNTIIDRMTALLDAMPDLYFRINPEGVILDYRTTRKRDLIAAPEDFLGRPLSTVLPADAYATFQEHLAIHFETNEVTEWEYQLPVDGVENWFEARLGRIAGPEKEMVIVIRNVTERRNAERGKMFAEATLERIISNLPGAVISLVLNGPNGRELTYVSKQVETIWGYTREEVYNDISLLSAAHDPKDVEDMQKLVAEAAKTLEPFQHRAKFKTRDGSWKWLESYIGITRSDDGTLHSDGFILDVTSQVETQELLDAQRELGLKAQKTESIGRLTGGVAHDFNNLLAVIMGNLELLRDELESDDQIELVDNSIGATQRGAELTRNMLSFARKARLEPKDVDLNQVLTQIKKWAGRTIPADIETEMNLTEGLWGTQADPSSTESALLNLILNARDAMPDGGKLTIETSNEHVDDAVVDGCGCAVAPGRYAVLTVRDTGAGIAQSDLARIFEPFYTTKPQDVLSCDGRRTNRRKGVV